ncbi:conserved protein, unknown function [Hepatocystis sp. ex Piliocolobus tephrosceles]|nr:conserved protein, unknown function [Hepatocystis sp. ex Piliocolobus tephrosceles]
MLYQVEKYTTINKKCFNSYKNYSILYKNNFGTYNNENITIKNENNDKDNNDEDDEKFNLDDSSDEEIESLKYHDEITQQNNDVNQTEKKYNNKEIQNNVMKMKKKSKYDSDVVIIYDDISKLPNNMVTTYLSEEEIEEVNTGVSNLIGDDYHSMVVFNKKKK